MARLFALADLHLSLAGHKPMDIFGSVWKDHPRRMAEAWDREVAGEDTVLLPGDLSWARNLDEAEPDLEWIGMRPGKTVVTVAEVAAVPTSRRVYQLTRWIACGSAIPFSSTVPVST